MSLNLSRARTLFHRDLIGSKTLSVDSAGIASNADKSQKLSCELALGIARALGTPQGGEKLNGQSSGQNFEEAVSTFLRETFPALSALRPGRWNVLNVGSSRRGHSLSQYEPYRHLDELAAAIIETPALAAILGNSYDISPDILVVRQPIGQRELSDSGIVVDGVASYSPLLAHNQSSAIIHAVVSCKWTLRSDRAQNARSEALNLIRNRKGRTPHIVVVTGEPTPSRLSSLALGTGDIDTVYHFALPELIAATQASGNEEAIKTLDTLVTGQRLRDIADLPLDLAI